MHRVNIVVAEDDTDDFLMLIEAVEEVLPKFNIHHAKSGRDLLNLINADVEPDLIFLDLNIPLKSGLACLKEIRQKPGLNSTPVIIYSTSSNFEDIDACYKNGCTLYLVKPQDYRDLVTQIRKVFFRIGLPKKDLMDIERFVVKKEESKPYL